ncbi:HGGxSTG domain-containing protein [Aliiglaciecola sp. NS0011-25]|uniref:HGGxSTG domain-containing protein n=1 Tax=Aliiglaciecola sp. NS0011-25 TaxID=3127654 RepID=UPI00310613DE
MTTEPKLRAKQVKALKAYYQDSTNSFNEWVAGGYKGKARESLPFPEICRDMKCEAKTRSGHPCKNDGTSWANGRCKYHGGASTGPVTPEGKKKVSMNSTKNKAFVDANI